jgi:hypothetical protein
MASKRSPLYTAGILAVAAAVIGGGVVLYRAATRNSIPSLSVPDIAEGTREFGRIQRVRGTSCLRAATAADESEKPENVSFANGKPPAGCGPVASGTSLRLGTLLLAPAQSGIEFSAQGNWYMALDGEGGIVLQDARRNASGSERVASVFVQRGMFRAKSGDGDGARGHYLEVTTAAAHVRVFAGELGMEVAPGGHGRMWLMSGRAVAYWKDGRSKELGLRGLEDL